MCLVCYVSFINLSFFCLEYLKEYKNLFFADGREQLKGLPKDTKIILFCYCVGQLTEAGGRGDVRVDVQLCMCESGVSSAKANV
jgi:hypothetical protein